MKNPGKIIRLEDERKVILYDHQPLVKEKGKIVLHLVDEKNNIIEGENKKPKTILKDADTFTEEMKGASVIGFVD